MMIAVALTVGVAEFAGVVLSSNRSTPSQYPASCVLSDLAGLHERCRLAAGCRLSCLWQRGAWGRVVIIG